jgi:hypothetical protein
MDEYRFRSDIIAEVDAVSGDFDIANSYLEAAIVLAKCGVDPDDAEEMCKVWARHQFSWGKEE